MIIYQVDAFTTEYFKGNPAGVCIMPGNTVADDGLLRNIAMEMNLSETAFVVKNKDGFGLRWFTPETEVDFCGHATLASAHILWETGLVAPGKAIEFSTRSGLLTARKTGSVIELDFPLLEVSEIQSDERINSIFGIAPRFTGKDDRRYLIELGSLEELLALDPDAGLLKTIGRTAFMLTCASVDGRYDFYSRFFAPAVGITEDPVTGSAHSYLAPYWSRKLGRNRLTGYQASKRGGEIECEVTDRGRVLLRGSAITVFDIKTRFDL